LSLFTSSALAVREANGEVRTSESTKKTSAEVKTSDLFMWSFLSVGWSEG
jgi:hypothetical protein